MCCFIFTPVLSVSVAAQTGCDSRYLTGVCSQHRTVMEVALHVAAEQQVCWLLILELRSLLAGTHKSCSASPYLLFVQVLSTHLIHESGLHIAEFGFNCLQQSEMTAVKAHRLHHGTCLLIHFLFHLRSQHISMATAAPAYKKTETLGNVQNLLPQSDIKT